MWKHVCVVLCVFTIKLCLGAGVSIPPKDNIRCMRVPLGTRASDAWQISTHCKKLTRNLKMDYSSVHCYKIVATDQNQIEYIGKGCMPPGGCEEIISLWDTAFKVIDSNGRYNIQTVFNNITCYECTGPGVVCNSAPKFVKFDLMTVIFITAICLLYK